jgi:integrase
MNIIERITENRPNISKSSIKTYNSILNSLYKKVFGISEIDINNFDKSDIILDHLKTLEPNKRKTILSALVVITDNKAYRQQMLEDIKDYNIEQNKQIKSENQKESWINKDTIDDLYNRLKKNAMILYKKENKTSSDYQDIQNYVILSLLGGIYIPPRRSKDYVNFKIKNINKNGDNYISKNNLIFNSYKTFKTYGTQTVEIPKELKTILNKWISINPTEYLLFDINNGQLSNVKLNQRLNKLFDKKVSVNQLRHTFLSDKYGDMIDRKNELSNDFKKMGSSIIQEKLYIKK